MIALNMSGSRSSVCALAASLGLLIALGPSLVLLILLCIICFAIGLIYRCVREGFPLRAQLNQRFEDWFRTFRFSQGLPFARDNLRFSDESLYAEKHSMTNSDVLDPILEQILDNLMQDYVDSWYGSLTTDKLFQASLKRTARRSVSAVKTCLAKVDWVPLLTRHFVDDFASHLRLYRKAKERLQSQRDLHSPKAQHRLDDLESLFFDLELEMEKSYCRDLVSTSPAYESAYLHDICNVLLYLLMPSEDFRSRPLRFLVREVFVTKVFVPLLDKLSDPSFVNRMIVWLLSELPINTDDFVTSLENCLSVQELEAVLESVHDEMNTIRSKGGGSSEQASIFSQQLSSLEFTESLIRKRMTFIANGPDLNEEEDFLHKPLARLKTDQSGFSSSNHRLPNSSLEFAEDACCLENDSVVHLPITLVLTHPTALSYFVEFLNQTGGQNHIDFYLAIEGFKSSMDHQIRSLAKGERLDADAQETLREAALFMYHQYLSQEAITRVPMSDGIVNKFLARLRNDIPSDLWFEQVQQKVLEILRTEDRFYAAFKRHKLYERMLDELGIGPAPSLSLGTDEDDASLLLEEEMVMDGAGDSPSPSRSSSSGPDFGGGGGGPGIGSLRTMLEHRSSDDPTAEGRNGTTVLVEMLGVGHQGRHLFALYNVRVIRAGGPRGGSSSNVIRRYSDFHALHNLIQTKFSNLRTLSFPGKKTFNNLDQNFLDKRCRALNQYMSCILQPLILSANPGLEQLVFDFLSQKNYSGKESFPHAMSTMFNPIVNGVKAFGSAAAAMPSDLMDGIGKMGSGLNKAATNMLKGNPARQRLQRNSSSSVGNLPDSNRVAAHIDANDSAENIPLRVLLLLVDEVFGLRAKNQWFRRRLVSLLRQFVNAALGNSISTRIIEAVNWLTSEEQVAQYLIAFRDSLWGDSAGAFSRQSLQQDSQRTRFMARCLLLTAVPNQLRLFIGMSTIQSGVENVSEALQNKHLNRRFWYVVLERLLVTMFPHNRFDRLLPQLHAKSPRTQMASD